MTDLTEAQAQWVDGIVTAYFARQMSGKKAVSQIAKELSVDRDVADRIFETRKRAVVAGVVARPTH